MDFVCVGWGGMLREDGNFDKKPPPPDWFGVRTWVDGRWENGDSMNRQLWKSLLFREKTEHWNHFSLSFYSPGSWKPLCYLILTFYHPYSNLDPSIIHFHWVSVSTSAWILASVWPQTPLQTLWVRIHLLFHTPNTCFSIILLSG